MHNIKWSDRQKDIFKLLVAGKSYWEVLEAGHGRENIDIVIGPCGGGKVQAWVLELPIRPRTLRVPPE